MGVTSGQTRLLITNAGPVMFAPQAPPASLLGPWASSAAAAGTLSRLISKHGDDLAAILRHLYDDFHVLEEGQDDGHGIDL